MEISDKLKTVIFKKLYMDLSHVEIIPYENSIWFIDRENKYWYFEYEKDGKLWWRYDFFQSFFTLFSLELNDFQPIISEWVEEVLNFKVTKSLWQSPRHNKEVEEVLYCKVTKSNKVFTPIDLMVEEVLNYKVTTPIGLKRITYFEVEEVLNYKVTTPLPDNKVFIE